MYEVISEEKTLRRMRADWAGERLAVGVHPRRCLTSSSESRYMSEPGSWAHTWKGGGRCKRKFEGRVNETSFVLFLSLIGVEREVRWHFSHLRD